MDAELQSRHERERRHSQSAIEDAAAWGWAAEWGFGSPAGRARARRRAALIGEAAGLGPGVRALEIGCGQGTFTRLFAETGAELTAIDLSPELIAQARSAVQNVDLVCCSLEAFSPGETRYDAVIGSSILHHLDLNIALPAIAGLLVPGGRFSFAEPNLLNPQIFIERRFRRFFSHISDDETAFTASQIARDLAGHGFVATGVTPFDWLHPATPQPLIRPVDRVGRTLERIPLVRAISGSLLIRAEAAS
jgi:2-polyprenyl-3-methyl-5-hydroxy-6-metoxy-1,4-benzoquinol methylase